MLPTIQLDKKLETALASGHPWIYRNHLGHQRIPLQDGMWLRVQAGKQAAIGLYDAQSPIALRLFQGQGIPGQIWVNTKVAEALSLRNHIDAKQTSAYRLIYGEGDYLPSITVDRYERFAIIKTYANSSDALVPLVVTALSSQLKLKGILSKNVNGLEALWGELPPPELSVKENGLKLIANLYEGQKTGLFLDHRDNRLTLEPYCHGKTVLNLFSYTGAFSLYGARGGASAITSVDIAPAVIEDAKRNFILNGFDPNQHRFESADCYKLLQNYVQQDKQFDVVILDPPSLAKAKKSKHAALRAYHKLNALAIRCVKEGGILASASCTSQVSPEDFKRSLAGAATETGLRLQIFHEAGHALDHPVPVNFPEGRYLKFVMARVLA